MRRALLSAALVAVAVATAACGSVAGSDKMAAAGDSGAAAAPMSSAAPTDSMAADASPSADAMGSEDMKPSESMAADDMKPTDSMAADDMKSADPMAKPKVPQITVMEMDSGNDGAMSMIKKGKLGAQAVAAGLGKDGLDVVTVTGTETGCVPDKVKVPAGTVWFKLTNKGMAVNEMYLESTKGKEIIEIENVQPGAFGAFKATLKAGGHYLIACEPGMKDKQIRTPFSATAATMM